MSSRSYAAASTEYDRKINMPVGARTLAGWGKTDVSGTQVIMNCEFWSGIPQSPHTTLEMITVAAGATNKLSVNFIPTPPGGGAGATTTAGMLINSWFHWALTIDSSNISVYLDGGSKGTNTHTGSLRGWPRHSIGATWGGGLPFNGQIAHVSTWGRALSDAEILALYEGRCPPMDVSMAGAPLGGLLYYAPLEHDVLCQFGQGVAGAQLEFTPINTPTFSDEDPCVYPMVGGIVAA